VGVVRRSIDGGVGQRVEHLFVEPGIGRLALITVDRCSSTASARRPEPSAASHATNGLQPSGSFFRVERPRDARRDGFCGLCVLSDLNFARNGSMLQAWLAPNFRYQPRALGEGADRSWVDLMSGALPGKVLERRSSAVNTVSR